LTLRNGPLYGDAVRLPLSLRPSATGLCLVALASSLALVACGTDAVPEAPAKVAEVVVAAPPQETAAKVEPEPPQAAADEPEPPEPTNVEPADACVAAMRDGRGLPGSAQSLPEAAQYSAALADERAGKMDGARRGFLKLLQSYPNSPYTALTYFGFGEMFLQEAQSDASKIELAIQSYNEVLKYPAPANTAYLAALLHLATAQRRKSDNTSALIALKKVFVGATKYPAAQCAAALAEPARNDMVVVFASVGRPDAAYEFFRSVGVDTGDGHRHAFAMIAALAEKFITAKKPDDAAAALLSAPATRAGTSFCKKEEQILARIETSVSAERNANLATARKTQCGGR
jgi:TolA-binding protein